jgi:hypothetical protein
VDAAEVAAGIVVAVPAEAVARVVEAAAIGVPEVVEAEIAATAKVR